MAVTNHLNLDPITDEPGAHPLGTGIGAALGGAAAGAAAGLVAGPAGALVGGVAGAFAGGMGGHAVAETANPTNPAAEAAYWQTNYLTEPYYESGRPFDDYAPAYRMGLFGYTEYSGDFDQTENRLATHWETQRERSSLSWPQAREASRAAWMRLDRQHLADQDHSDVIDTLNGLLEVCRDGEYGFKECAAHLKGDNLKSVLVRREQNCKTGAMELQQLIKRMGGKCDEGGTVSGAIHRGWVSVKGSVGGYSDKSLLDECERAEDVALAKYRKALKQNMPSFAKEVVEHQANGAQRNHDQIKALRDGLVIS